MKTPIEVWFTRYDDELYYAANYLDRAPKIPHRTSSVSEALRRKSKRYKIVQVGIVPPDALGLE